MGSLNSQNHLERVVIQNKVIAREIGESSHPATPQHTYLFRPSLQSAGGHGSGGSSPPFTDGGLSDADRIYVTQSECSAELLRSLGLFALALPQGSRSLDEHVLKTLAGKPIVILPAFGTAGEDFSRAVAEGLARIDPDSHVRVVRLPSLTQEGDDIVRWNELRRGQTRDQIRDELEQVVQQTTPWETDADNGTDDADDRKPNRRRPASQGTEADVKPKVPSQAESLLKLADSATYFHTPEGDAYASIPITSPGENGGTRVEHHKIRSKAFQNWLSYQYYKEKGLGLPRDAIETVIGTLMARAKFEGIEESVHLRVAEENGPDGQTFYLDLADKQGRVVRITKTGWDVMEPSPLKFRKSNTMQSLPEPERGGSVNDLSQFVNVETNDEFYLLIAILCTYLRPMPAFPILVIQGGQGSAKTTMTEIVTKLTDPCSFLRTLPRNTQDLMIAAQNSWVVTMNNLSGLSATMSDALCCLSDGGGFATRKLYEDQEETVFKATRPIALNGIDDIPERGDLLDRSVQLNLLRIPPEKLLTKEEFWSRFEALRPKILGALLDAVAMAMLKYSDVELERMPRMADFARWGEAVGRALGWGEGVFIEALEKNQNAASVATLEACPVASAVRKLMCESEEWNGTATELLKALTPIAGDEITRTNNWPKIANKLSNKLRRATTPLREVGIEIEIGTTGKERSIRIRKASPAKDGEGSSASSTSSASEYNTLPGQGSGQNALSLFDSSGCFKEETDAPANTRPGAYGTAGRYGPNMADGPDDADDWLIEDVAPQGDPEKDQ